jgi:hypothetical protein
MYDLINLKIIWKYGIVLLSLYCHFKSVIMKTQQETINFLESLVHSRFSLESLNKKLSDFFGEKVEVYNASQGRIDNGEDDDELADWNLMFGFESDELFVDGDIYFLPMRREGFDGATMYITEVGYEFQ